MLAQQKKNVSATRFIKSVHDTHVLQDTNDIRQHVSTSTGCITLKQNNFNVLQLLTTEAQIQKMAILPRKKNNREIQEDAFMHVAAFIGTILIQEDKNYINYNLSRPHVPLNKRND
ncbi:hypothetical protein ACJX0J_013867 [Zea mays]